MDIGPITDQAQRFRGLLDAVDGGEVLELGTMRWEQDRPTHHAHWMPDGVEHVRVDMLEGPDVDVVADAHTLVDTFGTDRFAAVIADAVWEHLVRPWVAAEQLAAVCVLGAPIYVSTHQTFPIHGYPDDYFRFSDRALASLFDEQWWDGVESRHAYPCKIIPPAVVTRWNRSAPAYLNVDLCAVRNGEPWTR